MKHFECSDPRLWNEAVLSLPGAHILQSWEWAEIKSAFGWKMLPRLWEDEQGKVVAAAMVLQRTVQIAGFKTPLRILYIPRGPLMDWEDRSIRNTIVDDLKNFTYQQKAFLLKIDPEVIIGKGLPDSPNELYFSSAEEVIFELQKDGWLFSDEQVQFANTVWLDLNGTEQDWMDRMKQKTRYNIRLAQRKGVTIRSGGVQDLPGLYKMYAETSIRDSFIIRSKDYYLKIWEKFLGCDKAEVLIAEVDGEAVAGLILFFFGDRAWYLYGMSTQQHREKMPNYLLQLEAMKLAGGRGCLTYDLWGAPTAFEEQDTLWNVYRFKEGLGGMVIRTIGAWDFPARKNLYRLYTKIMPGILKLMRRQGNNRVRKEVIL